MRVLFDLTSLADNFSGIERYALNITREYIKNTENDDKKIIVVFKHEVHQELLPFEKKQNIEFYVLKKSKKLYFNQIRLLRFLNKIKADYYFFLAFPAPIFFKRKNVYMAIHDMGCYDFPETMTFHSRLYFKISYKMAIRHKFNIITISKFSKERIEYFLKPKNKVEIIYCGVEDKFRKESSTIHIEKYSIPKIYNLTLSTIEPRKNLKLLINAYDILIKKGIDVVPLVLVGRKGWKIDDLLSGITEECKNKLFFTGFVDDDDLPDLYSNAKLFIFPSKYEGFGIPPLEALACGTQVLSSNSSCLPEILGDNVSYFENNNINDLVKKILNPTNVVISEKIQEKYKWNKEAEKINEYIKK